MWETMLDLKHCPRTQLHSRCLSICRTHLEKVLFCGDVKLGDAVRVLNIDFTSDMQVFFKPEEGQFRGCRTASQVHDGAWRHSVELRIVLRDAADSRKVPHMRTSVGVKFIHEAPAAEVAKMNWQRMESDSLSTRGNGRRDAQVTWWM